MFTNNYISFRRNLFFGLLQNKPITTNSGSLYAGYFTAPSGSQIYQYNPSQYDIGSAIRFPRCGSIPTAHTSGGAQIEAHMGVYFGTGSTPASLADYTLESPITKGLAFAGGLEGDSAYKDGKAEVTARYIVTNTSDAEINIWEIGCFVPVQMSTNSSYQVVMMERTVLTEPITIPPGESKMVTYKVAFNQTLSVD